MTTRKRRKLSVSVAIFVGGTQYTRLRYTPEDLLSQSMRRMPIAISGEILTAIEQAASFAAREMQENPS